MEENLEKYRNTIELCSSIMKDIKAERMSNTKMGKYVNVFSLWNEFSGISEPIHSRILHFSFRIIRCMDKANCSCLRFWSILVLRRTKAIRNG